MNNNSDDEKKDPFKKIIIVFLEVIATLFLLSLNNPILLIGGITILSIIDKNFLTRFFKGILIFVCIGFVVVGICTFSFF